MIVKTLNIDELCQLNRLFCYNDPEEMIQSNSQKIASGEIDIFGLLSDKELVGELRVMYSNLDGGLPKREREHICMLSEYTKDIKGRD